MIRKWAVSFFLMAVTYTLSAQQNNSLADGIWRAILERPDSNNIVFNFEIKDNAGKKIIYLRNAAERLAVDDITVKDDSVFIRLPFFDSRFKAAIVSKNEIRGEWIKRLADKDQVIRFVAFNNQPYRFKSINKKANADVSGRWATIFSDAAGNHKVDAVGVFKQKNNLVTGSFLTPSGDYRYLEGLVDGDSLKLSGFDGGFAIYFTAKIKDGKTLADGKYYSGLGASPQTWSAARDPQAKLPESLSSTSLKPGVEPKLNFTFKDSDGKTVSINDGRYKNKVVVVQILGSWCPNCMDETVFMGELYNKYKSRGVEVIGLAYERSTDFERSQNSVRNFMKRLKVEYPVLIPEVAVSDPQRAEKTLPQLERISAFPSTIFVDKKGEVQKIHAGFNGPGTGEDYEKQKEDYYGIIDALLADQ